MKKVRVLQLNVWTGRIKGALLDFFEKNEFDIICLQEAVWSDNKLLESFAVSVDQIKKQVGLRMNLVPRTGISMHSGPRFSREI